MPFIVLIVLMLLFGAAQVVAIILHHQCNKSLSDSGSRFLSLPFNPLAPFRKFVSRDPSIWKSYLAVSLAKSPQRERRWILLHISALKRMEEERKLALVLSRARAEALLRAHAHIASLASLWTNPTDELIDSYVNTSRMTDRPYLDQILRNYKDLRELGGLDLEKNPSALRNLTFKVTGDFQFSLFDAVESRDYTRALVVCEYWMRCTRLGLLPSGEFQELSSRHLQTVLNFFRRRGIGRYRAFLSFELPQFWETSAVFQAIRCVKRQIVEGSANPRPDPRVV